MKISIETLLLGDNALGEISRLELPVALAYKIAKVVSAVRGEIKIFNEIRVKKIKELGEEFTNDKGEKDWKVSDKNNDVWDKEYDKMLALQVDLKIPDIRITELKDLKLRPMTLSYLSWLIKE